MHVDFKYVGDERDEDDADEGDEGSLTPLVTDSDDAATRRAKGSPRSHSSATPPLDSGLKDEISPSFDGDVASIKEESSSESEHTVSISPRTDYHDDDDDSPDVKKEELEEECKPCKVEAIGEEKPQKRCKKPLPQPKKVRDPFFDRQGYDSDDEVYKKRRLHPKVESGTIGDDERDQGDDDFAPLVRAMQQVFADRRAALAATAASAASSSSGV
jgi:hypothetical protein